AANAGRIVIGEMEFVEHARIERVSLRQAVAHHAVTVVAAVAISGRSAQRISPGVTDVAIIDAVDLILRSKLVVKSKVSRIDGLHHTHQSEVIDASAGKSDGVDRLRGKRQKR